MSFSKFSEELQRHRQPDRCLVVLNSCPSTHQLGRRLIRDCEAEACTPPSTDIVAWEQSAGFGRADRNWFSPAGCGVYATMVRQIEIPSQELPIRVGVAAAADLGKWVDPPRCEIKWPNDILFRDRKLGGILIDVFSRQDEPTLALISLGVNVATSKDLPDYLLPSRTSSLGLKADAAELPRVVRDLIVAIDALLVPSESIAGSADGIVERYRALSVHRPGQRLVCNLTEGKVRGTFLGIDDRGFLRLEVDGAERLLVAGELGG